MGPPQIGIQRMRVEDNSQVQANNYKKKKVWSTKATFLTQKLWMPWSCQLQTKQGLHPSWWNWREPCQGNPELTVQVIVTPPGLLFPGTQPEEVEKVEIPLTPYRKVVEESQPRVIECHQLIVKVGDADGPSSRSRMSPLVDQSWWTPPLFQRAQRSDRVPHLQRRRQTKELAGTSSSNMIVEVHKLKAGGLEIFVLNASTTDRKPYTKVGFTKTTPPMVVTSGDT